MRRDEDVVCFHRRSLVRDFPSGREGFRYLWRADRGELVATCRNEKVDSIVTELGYVVVRGAVKL